MFFFPASAAEPDLPPVPVVPYYETAALVTMVWGPSARRELGKRLRAADLELFFQRADGVQIPVRPSSPVLEDAIVASALAPFVHDRVGAELDLVADRTDTFLLLTTLRWDEGRLVVSKARAPRGLQREGPTEEVLRERWGIGPLVENGRSFDPLARGLLDDAFGSLSPEELALVSRISFHRRPEPAEIPMNLDGVLAAQYLGARDRRPRIELYDASIAPTTHFVGEPDHPRPYPLKVVVHELGHAFADAPSWAGRLLVEDLNTAREQDRMAWEGLREVQTADTEVRRSTLVARMDARKAAAEAVIAHLNRGRAIEAAWAAAVGDELAPTLYGRTDRGEGFAEAFALHHVDRAALERASPRSAAWFAAGGHVQAAASAMAELDALAAPGFHRR